VIMEKSAVLTPIMYLKPMKTSICEGLRCVISCHRTMPQTR
jgi:hypothetical protein